MELKTETTERDDTRLAGPGGIGQFLAKVIIVVVAIGALLTYADNLVQSHIYQARDLGGSAFWHNVEHELDRLADPNSIAPKKRTELLRKLRAAAANYAPFLKAIEEGAGIRPDSMRSVQPNTKTSKSQDVKPANMPP